MLECEGFKMFHGLVQINARNRPMPQLIYGTWLYKPDTDCWYCGGQSYPAEIVQIVRVSV